MTELAPQIVYQPTLVDVEAVNAVHGVLWEGGSPLAGRHGKRNRGHHHEINVGDNIITTRDMEAGALLGSSLRGKENFFEKGGEAMSSYI